MSVYTKKISIIVPVYNVEKYLDKCLTSLVNQTFKDIEIIVVIDGATDNSLKVAQNYEKYDYVTLIESENQGIGAARNLGLEYANGEYILFVDSDDFIELDMCELLYHCARKYNSNIVLCGHQLYYENSISKKILYGSEKSVYENTSEECLEMFFNGYISGYLWNKMYKHEFLKSYDIKNPEGVCYEDMLFTLKVLINSEKITILNKVLYNYRQREFSLSQELSSSKILDYIDQIRICIEYSNLLMKEKLLSSQRKVFSVRCFLSAIYWYYRCLETEKKTCISSKIEMKLKEWEKEFSIWGILFLPTLSYKYKIIFILEKLNLYKFLINKGLL